MSVRKKLLAVFILVVFLMIFVLVVYYQASRRPVFPMAKPTIAITMVGQQDVQASLIAVGTLKAYQGIDLTAKVSGVVTHIYFPSNAQVTRGDIILEQETNVQLATLKQVKAELTLAEANYNRAIRLHRKHYMSQQDFEGTKEKYLFAKASLLRAEAEINNRTIAAPFDVVLGLMTEQEVDYAEQGQDLVTLTNLDTLYVDFFIPEQYINQIKKGDTIHIKSAIDPNKSVLGKVSLLENVINDKTYMLKVRAMVNNKNHFLRPGGFADITIFFGQKKKVLVVPQMAIVYSDKSNYVYRVINGTAKKTKVVLGGQIKELIVVTQGLQLGEKIVSAGTNKVFDGQPVNLSKQRSA